MDVLMVVLRAVHIGAGVLWAGWTFALVLFINPALAVAGPAGGQFMQALSGKTSLVKVMTVAPILVLITGLWLLWIVSGGLSVAYLSSVHGMTITTGSVLGIAAAIYGLGFVRPIAMRLGQLGGEIAAGGVPPTQEQIAELGTLKARMASAAKIVGATLGIVVLSMAIARYVY